MSGSAAPIQGPPFPDMPSRPEPQDTSGPIVFMSQRPQDDHHYQQQPQQHTNTEQEVPPFPQQSTEQPRAPVITTPFLTFGANGPVSSNPVLAPRHTIVTPSQIIFPSQNPQQIMMQQQQLQQIRQQTVQMPQAVVGQMTSPSRGNAAPRRPAIDKRSYGKLPRMATNSTNFAQAYPTFTRSNVVVTPGMEMPHGALSRMDVKILTDLELKARRFGLESLTETEKNLLSRPRRGRPTRIMQELKAQAPPDEAPNESKPKAVQPPAVIEERQKTTASAKMATQTVMAGVPFTNLNASGPNYQNAGMSVVMSVPMNSINAMSGVSGAWGRSGGRGRGG